MNSALRTRAKLCEAQVVEIFQIKKASPTSSAELVAKNYHISEKAVRDIWTGRTWTKETSHLDTTRVLFQKQIGRPKGCRDSKPRTAKSGRKTHHIDSESPVCFTLRHPQAEWLNKEVGIPIFTVITDEISSVSTVFSPTNSLSSMLTFSPFFPANFTRLSGPPHSHPAASLHPRTQHRDNSQANGSTRM